MSEKLTSKYLTPKELSEYLKIPVGSIYNLVYMEKIPYFKLGHLLRFDLEKIEEWLKRKEVSPNEN